MRDYDPYANRPKAARIPAGDPQRARQDGCTSDQCLLKQSTGEDHRGIRGRIRCTRGFGIFVSAGRFCRGHDELRNFLRVRAFHRQRVSADRRCLCQLCRTAAVACRGLREFSRQGTVPLTGAIDDRNRRSTTSWEMIPCRGAVLETGSLPCLAKPTRSNGVRRLKREVLD